MCVCVLCVCVCVFSHCLNKMCPTRWELTGSPVLSILLIGRQKGVELVEHTHTHTHMHTHAHTVHIFFVMRHRQAEHFSLGFLFVCFFLFPT